MKNIKIKKKEYLLVTLLGLIIMAALNSILLITAPEPWTSIRYGAWSAFTKHFSLSGFDPFTYVTIAQWRPLYVHLRHPILTYYIYPLSEINDALRHAYGINFAIYILSATWTLIATASWLLLYKIMRQIIGMKWWESLLLCLFYYSFAYVMLAMFAPDHMLLSMTTTLLLLYLVGKAQTEGKTLSTWKTLIIYFIGTGITTTNAVKLWLIDIAGRWKKNSLAELFKHSMWYFIPTLIMVALYFYQENTANVDEKKFQQKIEAKQIEKDSIGFFAKKEANTKRIAKRAKNQMGEGALFEWTDFSIPVVPLLVDNIFGEGLQLHQEHLLEDANAPKNPRPVIIEYNNWYNNTVEIIIVLLFVLGIIASCRQHFFWIAAMPFLFDMIIHVGFRFAASDVYIMTAHWAFIIPIAIAYLIKSKPIAYIRNYLLGIIAVITAFLWIYNTQLTWQFLNA